MSASAHCRLITHRSYCRWRSRRPSLGAPHWSFFDGRSELCCRRLSSTCGEARTMAVFGRRKDLRSSQQHFQGTCQTSRRTTHPPHSLPHPRFPLIATPLRSGQGSTKSASRRRSAREQRAKPGRGAPLTKVTLSKQMRAKFISRIQNTGQQTSRPRQLLHGATYCFSSHITTGRVTAMFLRGCRFEGRTCNVIEVLTQGLYDKANSISKVQAYQASTTTAVGRFISNVTFTELTTTTNA